MALSTNLEAYYSLDEASGNALDSVAGLDLTDTNTVGAASGKVAGCRQFVLANSEQFSRTDAPALSFGDEDFSIAGWIYVDTDEGFQVLMCKGVAGVGGEYALYREGGTLTWFVANGIASQGSVDSSAAGVSGWHFIVCTHSASGNQLAISVDDGTPATASYSAGCNDGTATFRMGCYHNSSSFYNGKLDEWGFWRRVLTSGEITELYNGGAGRTYAYITGGAPAAVPRPPLTRSRAVYRAANY